MMACSECLEELGSLPVVRRFSFGRIRLSFVGHPPVDWLACFEERPTQMTETRLTTKSSVVSSSLKTCDLFFEPKLFSKKGQSFASEGSKMMRLSALTQYYSLFF